MGVDGLLDDLGWEGEEGDGSEVLEFSGVGGWFLQQGFYLGMFFQSTAKVSIFNGAVDGVVKLGGEGGGCSMKDVMPHPKYFADLTKDLLSVHRSLCVLIATIPPAVPTLVRTVASRVGEIIHLQYKRGPVAH